MPVGTAADSSSLAAVITAYLNGTSSPEPFQTAAPQTHRVSHGAPITLPKIPKKSQKFPCKRHAPAPRIPPLPSRCPAYPTGTFAPEPFQTAAPQPTGYPLACHGVARQGEYGRTHLVRQVRQVRQVRHKRHAPATRIPPLPN